MGVMAKLSMRNAAWLISVLVIGSYMITVEAALFLPTKWYALTNILIPVQAAVLAWTVLSVLMFAESLVKRSSQELELLISGISLVASGVSTYTLLFSTLGGGLYWSLVEKIDLEWRLLIGPVFFIVCVYVVVSPWVDRDKWVKVGEVSIDTAQLLLTDPIRIKGGLPPMNELGGLKESKHVLYPLSPSKGFKGQIVGLRRWQA